MPLEMKAGLDTTATGQVAPEAGMISERIVAATATVESSTTTLGLGKVELTLGAPPQPIECIGL